MPDGHDFMAYLTQHGCNVWNPDPQKRGLLVVENGRDINPGGEAGATTSPSGAKAIPPDIYSELYLTQFEGQPLKKDCPSIYFYNKVYTGFANDMISMEEHYWEWIPGTVMFTVQDVQLIFPNGPIEHLGGYIGTESECNPEHPSPNDDPLCSLFGS